MSATTKKPLGHLTLAYRDDIARTKLFQHLERARQARQVEAHVSIGEWREFVVVLSKYINKDRLHEVEGLLNQASGGEFHHNPDCEVNGDTLVAVAVARARDLRKKVAPKLYTVIISHPVHGVYMDTYCDKHVDEASEQAPDWMYEDGAQSVESDANTQTEPKPICAYCRRGGRS